MFLKLMSIRASDLLVGRDHIRRLQSLPNAIPAFVTPFIGKRDGFRTPAIKVERAYLGNMRAESAMLPSVVPGWRTHYPTTTDTQEHDHGRASQIYNQYSAC
jgi:hypothetical protein